PNRTRRAPWRRTRGHPRGNLLDCRVTGVARAPPRGWFLRLRLASVAPRPLPPAARRVGAALRFVARYPEVLGRVVVRGAALDVLLAESVLVRVPGLVGVLGPVARALVGLGGEPLADGDAFPAGRHAGRDLQVDGGLLQPGDLPVHAGGGHHLVAH